MNFELLHPAEQIVMIMERIYGYGMTTTSGGNLSILDEEGNMWISPAGVDKGSLTDKDIICVKQDGTIVGNHKPSSEYPFHQLIYKERPDIQAIVHAHPPALVAFSIVRKIPLTGLIPNIQLVCGGVGLAEYGLPGSRDLGEKIAKEFAKGINTILLENHGIVVGGGDLFEAFMALPFGASFMQPALTADIFVKETPIAIVNNDCVIVTGSSLLNAFDRLEVLEYSAKAVIASKALGDVVTISDAHIEDLIRAFNL